MSPAGTVALGVNEPGSDTVTFPEVEKNEVAFDDIVNSPRDSEAPALENLPATDLRYTARQRL